MNIRSLPLLLALSSPMVANGDDGQFNLACSGMIYTKSGAGEARKYEYVIDLKKKIWMRQDLKEPEPIHGISNTEIVLTSYGVAGGGYGKATINRITGKMTHVAEFANGGGYTLIANCEKTPFSGFILNRKF